MKWEYRRHRNRLKSQFKFATTKTASSIILDEGEEKVR
jgi:hypothetical protein